MRLLGTCPNRALPNNSTGLLSHACRVDLFARNSSKHACSRIHRTPREQSSSFVPVIAELNRSYVFCFGEQLHGDTLPDLKVCQRLSVGPLEEDWAEFAELAKDLYSWVVEGLHIRVLRKPHNPPPNEKLRQIKLIELLMSGKLTCASADIQAVAGPLHDLNAVRVKFAHNSNKPPELRAFRYRGSPST